MNHPPVDVGQATVDAARAEGEPFVVDSQEVQHGGVQVVAVGAAFDGLIAELVALAVRDSRRDAVGGRPVTSK